MGLRVAPEEHRRPLAVGVKRPHVADTWGEHFHDGWRGGGADEDRPGESFFTVDGPHVADTWGELFHDLDGGEGAPTPGESCEERRRGPSPTSCESECE